MPAPGVSFGIEEEFRRLAARGTIDKDNAVRLLQIPHRPNDLLAVVTQFERQLSREARSMLTLDALVPPPTTVAANQRVARFFDKYPVSGSTYTTDNGAVVPTELQYYDGQMVHLHGECANVTAVADALDGSGYRPIVLVYPNGRQAAVVQVWSSAFVDSTLGPYSAMFIVVAAAPADAPLEESSIRADPQGASSVLAMVRGMFDPVANRYYNAAVLFMLRLVDTTQIAIDVGRERMGTDKRPGTIEMTNTAQRLQLAINDARGRGIVRATLDRSTDPAGFARVVGAAARTAGIPFRELPGGTEYVFPAAARIDTNPTVTWQWRTDVLSTLQPIAAGAVTIDASSEEGGMLRRWGFDAKVFGYIPHVRGVITGLPTPRRSGRGGAMQTLHGGASSVVDSSGAVSPVAGGDDARPTWNTRFLGTMTASLQKEVVGITPDGLRIDWHVTRGQFSGPGVAATVLPGAADWMRIRQDGIGVMHVQACLETSTGGRVYAEYDGHCDFGPDGYARAVRGDFGISRSVVVKPMFATQDPQFAWLNRLVCIGVGSVDVRTLRVQFDVYAIDVIGDDKVASGGAQRTELQKAVPDRRAESGTLYARMGGRDVIAPMAEDFIGWVVADDQLSRLFRTDYSQERWNLIRQNVVDYFCRMAGGECVYRGRDMKAVHAGLGIDESDWKVAAALLVAALTKHQVRIPEQAEFMRLIEGMKNTIID